jgi:amidohydrolase
MTPFLKEAQDLFEYTRGLRRDFHMHPELGFEEVRTAGIVASELHKLGLEVTTGIAHTGVMAVLEGAKPGRVVLLRVDMDALPVNEATGAEYASQSTGKMHACGHDGHTAIGLTAARLLHAHRDELAGTVKFIFQPAEEGLGGANRMLAEGILDAPVPDVALGLHVWNEKPVGWWGIAPGPVMAGADTFSVRILGKGGHGAAPHFSQDPVAAAAQVITALQSIVARNVAPLKSAVISVTRIRGGEAFNVIPQEVEFTGTIRTFEEAVHQTVLERFHQVVEGVAQAMGCQAEINIQTITPAVVNDPQVAVRLQRLAAELSPQATVEISFQTMGSEDMAFILQKVPGCFVMVGSANFEKGLSYGHHHPRFDFDEQVLPAAAAFAAEAVFELGKK